MVWPKASRPERTVYTGYAFTWGLVVLDDSAVGHVFCLPSAQDEPWEYSQQGSDLLDTGQPGSISELNQLIPYPSRVARPFLITNPQIPWLAPTSMKGSAFCFFFSRCFGPRDSVQTFLPIFQGGFRPCQRPTSCLLLHSVYFYRHQLRFSVPQMGPSLTQALETLLYSHCVHRVPALQRPLEETRGC